MLINFSHQYDLPFYIDCNLHTNNIYGFEFFVVNYYGFETKNVFQANRHQLVAHRVFPIGSVVKNQPANAGDATDVSSIPGLGRSPGVGNGNPNHDGVIIHLEPDTLECEVKWASL